MHPLRECLNAGSVSVFYLSNNGRDIDMEIKNYFKTFDIGVMMDFILIRWIKPLHRIKNLLLIQ